MRKFKLFFSLTILIGLSYSCTTSNEKDPITPKTSISHFGGDLNLKKEGGMYKFQDWDNFQSVVTSASNMDIKKLKAINDENSFSSLMSLNKSRTDDRESLSNPLLALLSSEGRVQIGDKIYLYINGLIYKVSKSKGINLPNESIISLGEKVGFYKSESVENKGKQARVSLHGNDNDSRYQYEFDYSLSPYKYKYVNDLRSFGYCADGHCQASLNLIIKLEYRRPSKSYWTVAQRETNISYNLYGDVDLLNTPFPGTFYHTFNTYGTIQEFNHAGHYNLVLGTANWSQIGAENWYWSVEVNGSITQKMSDDLYYNETPWTVTGYPLW